MSQSDSSVQNITSTEDEEEDDDQPLDSVSKGFLDLLTKDYFQEILFLLELIGIKRRIRALLIDLQNLFKLFKSLKP